MAIQKASDKSDKNQRAETCTDEELEHDGPLAIRQEWERYTPEEHHVWQLLYCIQNRSIAPHACILWHRGVETLKLERMSIPNLSRISEILSATTGWQAVPVSGVLNNDDFYAYLAAKQYPCVASLRPRSRVENYRSPDIFRDAVGTLTLLTDPQYAQFLEGFGKLVGATTDASMLLSLRRAYWHIVEHGIIIEDGMPKAVGKALIADLNTRDAIFQGHDQLDIVSFDMAVIANRPFHPHALPKTLFSIESFDALFQQIEKYTRNPTAAFDPQNN